MQTYLIKNYSKLSMYMKTTSVINMLNACERCLNHNKDIVNKLSRKIQKKNKQIKDLKNLVKVYQEILRGDK